MDLKERGQEDVYYSRLSPNTDQVGVSCEHGNELRVPQRNFGFHIKRSLSIIKFRFL